MIRSSDDASPSTSVTSTPDGRSNLRGNAPVRIFGPHRSCRTATDFRLELRRLRAAARAGPPCSSMRAVGEVEARDVHPCVDEAAQALHRVAGWAQRANELRATQCGHGRPQNSRSCSTRTIDARQGPSDRWPPLAIRPVRFGSRGPTSPRWPRVRQPPHTSTISAPWLKAPAPSRRRSRGTAPGGLRAQGEHGRSGGPHTRGGRVRGRRRERGRAARRPRLRRRARAHRLQRRRQDRRRRSTWPLRPAPGGSARSRSRASRRSRGSRRARARWGERRGSAIRINPSLDLAGDDARAHRDRTRRGQVRRPA